MPGVLLSARSGLSWILLVFLAFTFVPQVQADEAPAWLATVRFLPASSTSGS